MTQDNDIMLAAPEPVGSNGECDNGVGMRSNDSAVSGLHRAKSASVIGRDDVSVCSSAAGQDDSSAVASTALQRSATTMSAMQAETAVEDEAEDGDAVDEQSRFKLFVGILKKLVGVRDIVSMRISVPAQLLEPMSNLEYWNYMDRPDYFACLADPEDPLDRMLGVIRWWFGKDLKHVHGKLVKPYNSTLGEQFICSWKVPLSATPGDAAVAAAQSDANTSDNCTVTCVTEQISHHPPVSAFHYGCEEKGVSAVGIDHLCIGFSGTSIKIAAGEQNHGIFVRLSTRDGEEYHLTHPHAHVNGWLRGNPYIVMADCCIVTCAKTGMQAVLEYKEEKWIGRAKHAIAGRVFRYDTNADGQLDARRDKRSIRVSDDRMLATLSGSWRESIYYTRTGSKAKDTLLVDLSAVKPIEKLVRPLEELGEHESRRVWQDVTQHIMAKNFAAANRAKHLVEEHQRQLAIERKQNSRPAFTSVYFDVPEPGYPQLKRRPDRY